MAASFMSFVGRPSAPSKSKPTQPVPRLKGSRTTRPPKTGAGTPTEMTLNSQSRVRSSTPATISSGVMLGPEGKRRRSLSPFTSILTREPPTSTASTSGAAGSVGAASSSVPLASGIVERQQRHDVLQQLPHHVRVRLREPPEIGEGDLQAAEVGARRHGGGSLDIGDHRELAEVVAGGEPRDLAAAAIDHGL